MAGKGRPENLKPYPKGVSGNPGGRPKSVLSGSEFKKLLEKYGEMTAEELSEAAHGATVKDKIAIALLGYAMKGNMSAMSQVLDRWIGKVKDESSDDSARAEEARKVVEENRDGVHELLKRSRAST